MDELVAHELITVKPNHYRCVTCDKNFDRVCHALAHVESFHPLVDVL